MHMLVKDKKDGHHKFFFGENVILNLTHREGLELASYLINQARNLDSVHRNQEFSDTREGKLSIHMTTLREEG